MTMTDGPAVRVLILEDRPEDADLLLHELRRAGFLPEHSRVESEEAYRAGLAADPDVILADYTLPQFDALRALHILQESRADIPFLVVTGSVGEERAVECMREGATDYLLKDRLTRLAPAVKRALEEKRVRSEKRSAEDSLRRSEEYYRSVIENTRDVVIVIDVEGTILYQSPSVEPVLGHRPEERIGGTVLDHIHPADRQAAKDQVAMVFRNPGHTYSIVARVQHADGSWRTIEALGCAHTSSDGEHRTVINARDITDRIQLEEQLRQAQKLEAIGQLAGGVAHDFNNMLTVIGGYADFIEQEANLSESTRESAREIAKAHERGAALTRQLLAFARKQVLQPRVIDLNDVIGDLRNFLRRLIGANIEFSVNLHDSPVRVVADPGQIEQVVMNLVVNARDAMLDGGHLTVSTSCDPLSSDVEGADSKPRYAVIEVRDTGCGMDEATQSRIFDPFFTTKPRGKGTGLGLSTVYGIVDQSEGHIEVTSERDEGTSLQVFLPYTSAATEPLVGQPHADGAAGGETILVAEDDSAIRRLVRTILERLGYTILEARSGVDAMRVSQEFQGPIHLLVTDLVMPGLGGGELAARFRQIRPDVAVLYLTGYTDETIERQGGMDGSGALLVKPFSPATLSGKVRQVLDRQRADSA